MKLTKQKSDPIPLESLPTTRRKIGKIGGYPVYEHRCFKRETGAEKGYAITFPEIACEDAKEFNEFIRGIGAIYRNQAEKALKKNSAPYCAIAALRLQKTGEQLSLFLHTHSGNPHKTLKPFEKRCFLSEEGFRFLAPQGLTKKQKKSIL